MAESLQAIANWNSQRNPLEHIFGGGCICPSLVARGQNDNSMMILISEDFDDERNLREQYRQVHNCRESDLQRVFGNDEQSVQPKRNVPCNEDIRGGNTEIKIIEKRIAKCIGGIGEMKSNSGTQFYQQNRVYEGDVALAQPANLSSGSYLYKIEEPTIAALRSRHYDGKDQRLEIGSSDKTNTITSVQKDNVVIEPKCLRFERTEDGKKIRKDYESGKAKHGYSEYKQLAERNDGLTNTLSTVTKDNMILEKCVKVKSATRGGYEQAREYDGINLAFP